MQELNKVMGMVCERERYYYNAKKVDAVLAEKDAEIQRLEKLCESYRIDCDNLAISNEQAKRAARTLLKKMNHNKYKRCLAMARVCRLRARWFGDNAFYKKEQWALQWHKRWLELAEKFKEAK